MSKRMVTYSVTGDDKIASIDGHEVGGGVSDKSISRRMITYKVDESGKITSIDGHELNGGGSGDYEIKELVVTENGTYTAEEGKAFNPVKVDVSVEGNPLQYIVDNQGGNGVPKCNYLFYYYNGTSLDKAVKGLDTSKVTDFSRMFASCTNLTSVPALDTSNGTIFNRMFQGCTNIISVPALDTSKGTDFTDMFISCNKLTSIGIYGFTRSIVITPTALEHDAIVAFLNQAGTAYNSSQKITMGSAKLALLSDEEKAIATNKGWQLA